MTSQVVRSLESKGMVERQVDEGDTRLRRLSVTRRRGRLAPRAIGLVQQVDAAFFTEFSGWMSCISSACSRVSPSRRRHTSEQERKAALGGPDRDGGRFLSHVSYCSSGSLGER